MTAGPRLGAQTPFAIEVLDELRERGYRPRAWTRFLAHAWRQSRITAAAHPDLAASWARTTVTLVGGTAAALAYEARLGQMETARRALPLTALCFAYQQFDVYAHLGLHAPAAGAPLRREIGAPTTLTLLRGATAALLWGHLAAGRPVSPGYLGAALGLAGATDIADGALARRRDQATRLGAYLDAEADLSFGLATALTLAAHQRLPRWLVAVMLARWAGPFAFACASYFGAAHPVALAGTRAGKAAGLAQTAVVVAALLPTRRNNAPGRWRGPLHLASAAILVAAPITQVLRVLGPLTRPACHPSSRRPCAAPDRPAWRLPPPRPPPL